MQELLRLKFYEKNNDLYQFHQVSVFKMVVGGGKGFFECAFLPFANWRVWYVKNTGYDVSVGVSMETPRTQQQSLA